MPMGLLNSPATFQAVLNGILSDLLDVGVLCYVDDLLVYAKTKEEHDGFVLEVLKRLQDNNLAVNPKKCTWASTQVEYLGYIINEHGISMSTDKVDCIINWKSPTTLKEVQRFVGFANFYRRFINAFSRIVKPLTDSTKLDCKSWRWTIQMENAFQALKEAFTNAPVLIHFNPSSLITIETDSSDFAIGAVLSQKGDDGKIHPVAFHSRKLLPTEINYDIHDKELLAIVDCFGKWRRYLEGAKERIEVFSDHHNLMHFQTAKVLNRRQARWAQQLATYRFVINFKPGTLNTKADILSRREEYRPEKGGDEDQPITSVLQEKHFSNSEGPSFLLSSARLCSLTTPKWNSDFLAKVKKAAKHDEEYQQQLRSPGKDVTNEEDVLFKKNRLWIPRDKELRSAIIKTEHDTKVAGHMGMDKTSELIRRNMWWPDLDKEVTGYVTGCFECQRTNHVATSLLDHSSPWKSITHPGALSRWTL